MSKILKPQKLKGFQDIFGDNCALKEDLLEKIRHKAKLANFSVLETPCLEYTETLLGVGGETDKQVFRFTDNGGRDVALRYDLTVPFARFVAENQGKLILPYKRFQVGKVWRAEKPQKGRYREFSQCDFDIIGVDNEWTDIEIVSLFYTIFSDVIGLPFTMHLGFRQVVSAVIYKIYGKNLSLESEKRILINLDKAEKIGAEKVCKLIAEETETRLDQAEELVKKLAPVANPLEQLDSLKSYLEGDEDAQREINRLATTIKILNQICCSTKGKIKLNLSVVRGLAYYTGLVFETTLDDFSEFGSVGSGGRYDDLSGRFMKESLSGIGGSVGIDRLLAALLSREESNTFATHKKAMIAVATPDARDYAFTLLSHLRANNIACDVHLKDQKITQQFKFANRAGYNFVLTVGTDEKQESTANLKDMQTGQEQKKLSFPSLIKALS